MNFDDRISKYQPTGLPGIAQVLVIAGGGGGGVFFVIIIKRFCIDLGCGNKLVNTDQYDYQLDGENHGLSSKVENQPISITLCG